MVDEQPDGIAQRIEREIVTKFGEHKRARIDDAREMELLREHLVIAQSRMRLLRDVTRDEIVALVVAHRAECEAYEQEVARLGNQNERLKDSVATLESQRRELRAELDALKAKSRSRKRA